MRADSVKPVSVDSEGSLADSELEGKRLAVLLVHDGDEHEVIAGVIVRSDGPTRLVLDWSPTRAPMPLPDDTLERIKVLSPEQQADPVLADCDLLSFLTVGALPVDEPDIE
jgi:hypothetical protein